MSNETTTKTNDPAVGMALVHKLESVDPDQIIIFTREEAEALREVSQWWRRVQGARAIGGALGTLAKWTLIMVALAAALRAGMADWILGGGNPK